MKRPGAIRSPREDRGAAAELKRLLFCSPDNAGLSGTSFFLVENTGARVKVLRSGRHCPPKGQVAEKESVLIPSFVRGALSPRDRRGVLHRLAVCGYEFGVGGGCGLAFAEFGYCLRGLMCECLGGVYGCRCEKVLFG